MRQLMKLPNPGSASLLQWMLQDAGIESEVTTEITNAYTGETVTVVWVGEDADEAVIQDVCAEHAAQSRGNKADAAPTRVDSKREHGTLCVRCRYDLQGQVEDGQCPECGHPYQIRRERVCPHCRAKGPAEFDVCWKCGKDTGGQDGDEIEAAGQDDA